MRLIDADALIGDLHTRFFYDGNDRSRVYEIIQAQPTIKPEPSQVARDIATIIENEQDMRVIERNDIVRCKDCKHNPKDEWFGCPMSHLNEKQRPDTAWCWKGERRTDDRV